MIFFGIHKKIVFWDIFRNWGEIFIIECLNVEVVMETPVSYFARIVSVFMKKISPL